MYEYILLVKYNIKIKSNNLYICSFVKMKSYINFNSSFRYVFLFKWNIIFCLFCYKFDCNIYSPVQDLTVMYREQFLECTVHMSL